MRANLTAGSRPGRAPSCEVAAYAEENVRCRDCGAPPGHPCPPDPFQSWMLVCRARFLDGVALYEPVWKAAR